LIFETPTRIPRIGGRNTKSFCLVVTLSCSGAGRGGGWRVGG